MPAVPPPCHKASVTSFAYRRIGREQERQVNLAAGGAMTVTQIYILAWASLSMGVVAILLRFLGVKDEQGRANRD